MILRLAALLLLAAIHPTVAQEIGDIARGRLLAETWCGTCHAAPPADARVTGGRTPTLQAIADRSATTPLSLRVFLQTPHDTMPNLKLSQDETDDLIRYVLSLRQH